MKGKIICIIVFVNMLLCAAVVSSISNEYDNNEKQNCLNDDILDQAQIVVEEGLPVGNFQLPNDPRYNWSIAQSYTPGLVVLTRVKLLLARNSIPPTVHPLVMTIRKTLTGENLAMGIVNPEDVLEFPDYDWVEFDIEDIAVDAGKEYFIVCYTVNETDNAYVWGANPNDPYPAGQVYISVDNGNTWDGNPPAETADMCFMTYGRNNTKPDPPIIDGPPEGSVNEEYDYEFSAYDPDGDDMTYYVEWGDGKTDTGFVPSNGASTLSHIWTSKGDYEIRAKLIDVFGYESDWASLSVNMPRDRLLSNTLFMRLLERFPNLFPLFRGLLFQR